MEGTELYPTPGTLSAEDTPPNPPGSPLSMTIVTTFTAVQPILRMQQVLFGLFSLNRRRDKYNQTKRQVVLHLVNRRICIVSSALLLVYILLRWSGDCVLLKQLEPPNGTSACPGDKIKLVCESTFQNEATLTWQVIGGNCSSGFWGNLKKASKGTLMLPNGDNGTWEVETLDDTTKTFTLSLTINASLDLHNVTIACCSEHSPSLCSDSAAIPNEYKGIAVINISADSKCGNTSEHYSSEQDATQPKDQAIQYNLVWGVVSIISLIVCGLDFIIQLITFRCSTPDKKMKFWVLIILFSATLFAFINVIQIPIYQSKIAKQKVALRLVSSFKWI
eukprot:Em0012g972a